MAAITGKELYVYFGTDLSGDYRAFEANETGDSIDVSAGSDTAVTYLTRLKDGTATYSAIMQADGSVVFSALALHTSDTLIWADEGTAGGKQKHSVAAIVTARGRAIPYAGVVEITATFQFNGAVTDEVY